MKTAPAAGIDHFLDFEPAITVLPVGNCSGCEDIPATLYFLIALVLISSHLSWILSVTYFEETWPYVWFLEELNFSYLNQNMRMCLYKLHSSSVGSRPLVHVTWAILRIDQKEVTSYIIKRSNVSDVFLVPKCGVTLPFTIFSLVKANLFLVFRLNLYIFPC